MARAFLIEAHMSTAFRANAIQTIVFTISGLPTPDLHGKSPFEKLFQKSLDYNFLKTFGCTC